MSAVGLLAVFVPLLGAATLSVGIYDFLSGRDLVRDMLDKHRLRQRSLLDWDAHWAANPHQSSIVVCLTTTPSRVDRIHDTLRSLMAQTLRPARIRLHLPDFSLRENRIYHVPSDLKALRSLEIVHCEDYGPATKLIPALEDLDPDQAILVVDDDMVYPPDLLEQLETRARIDADRVWCSSGWIVPDDLTDRPTTLVGNVLQRPPVPLKCSRVREIRPIDVFQGYSGYLVRPRFFDLAAVTDYGGAPAQATWVDDVWLSAHCRAPKSVFPYRRYPCQYWRSVRAFGMTALGHINSGDGDLEKRGNTIMIRHFADRWTASAGLARADAPS